MELLLRDGEVDGRRVDVAVRGGRLTAVTPAGTGDPSLPVVDAAGCAVLPGLHDHHLHLLAMAAAARSVRVGPAEVSSADALGRALRGASGDGVRAVGYVESVAGELDRDRLDTLVPDRPVRVQHRSGALWMLNSAAIRLARLDEVDDPGVERDANGQVTGRLWRWDERLRARLPAEPPPDLGAVSRRLAGYGLTGVTDATPDLDSATLGLLGAAVADGTLSQGLTLLGVPLDTAPPPGIAAGPYKILLPDHDLPTWGELLERVSAAHGAGRHVAVHCVTRESLLLTLAVLDVLGRLGDRIEHASVVPAEARGDLARLGVRVVTQPGFLADRGDAYLRDVEPDDRALLYPHASLCAAGVPVAVSSDAPYGPESPWHVIAAARDRRAPTGEVVAAAERVTAARALAGYMSPAIEPGGAVRRVAIGEPADLVLLDRPLAVALDDPVSVRPRLTLRAGRSVGGRE